MTTGWTIRSSDRRLELGNDGTAEVTFTVTNPSDERDKAVFDVLPLGSADPAWFEFDDPERLVLPGWSAAYLVRIKVPAEARRAGRTYGLQGRVRSAETDSGSPGSSGSSGADAAEVTSERVMIGAGSSGSATAKPPRRRLLILVAALAVVAVAGIGWLLFRPTDVIVPAVVGKTDAQARGALKETELAVGTVTKRHDLESEPGTVRGQKPAAGTEVPPGSKVSLELAIHLAGPTLQSPADNAAIRSAQFPHLTWIPVPDARGYRLDVQREWCLSLLGGRKSCDWIIDRVDITGTTSARPTLDEPAGEGLFSGRVRWQVSALDDAGRPGSPSQQFTFQRPRPNPRR